MPKYVASQRYKKSYRYFSLNIKSQIFTFYIFIKTHFIHNDILPVSHTNKKKLFTCKKWKVMPVSLSYRVVCDPALLTLTVFLHNGICKFQYLDSLSEFINAASIRLCEQHLLMDHYMVIDWILSYTIAARAGERACIKGFLLFHLPFKRIIYQQKQKLTISLPFSWVNSFHT